MEKGIKTRHMRCAAFSATLWQGWRGAAAGRRPTPSLAAAVRGMISVRPKGAVETFHRFRVKRRGARNAPSRKRGHRSPRFSLPAGTERVAGRHKEGAHNIERKSVDLARFEKPQVDMYDIQYDMKYIHYIFLIIPIM